MSSQIEMDLGGLLPIAEKRKLLNHFIIKAEEGQVNSILENCKNLPSTQFNLLKLLLADKFHRTDLIIELLYDGDSSIISKATSKPWLYKGEDSAFSDSDFLINELFPNVSYNCRQKVLYRIGRHMRNEEKADKIWNAVEHRYGLHVAFPLVQACSKDKINSVITNRKVDLTGYQLVQVLQKYPDIGLKYLKDKFTNIVCSGTNSYSSPLVYLYDNHREDFLDIFMNHSDKVHYFKFGRSRSTKMIRAYREKLLEKPVETSSLLKVDRIRREFSPEQFQTLFESTLTTPSSTPANLMGESMWKWVNTVPINKRVDMVDRAFKKLFNVNLDEQNEFMSPEYIVLLPDEKRLSAIQWKSENDQNHAWTYKDIYTYYYKDEEKKRAWLSLKPTKYSVPELQKLLLIEQDLTSRTTLSKYLIETCYINEDLPQLLNVLSLLSKRCRNDQVEVRTEIFRTLGTFINKMEFTKEHWDIVIEMIKVALVFADNRDWSDSEKEKLLQKCIAFHLTSKLPLNNLVSMQIKLKIKTSAITWSNTYIKNEADRRSLLELYAQEIENLQLKNDLRSHDGLVLESKQLSEFIANLIEEICNFNESAARASQKLAPISIASHQWLRSSLEKIAKDEEERINKKSNLQSNCYSTWDFAKQLVKIVQSLRKEQSFSLDAFNDSESLFTKILDASPCSSIVEYFLGKNPSHLIENWPETISKMLKSESALDFMKSLKSWNYPTFIAQTIKACLEIIDQTLDNDSEVTIEQKCNSVSVLSVLSQPSDFLSLAERFYPVEEKVDVTADNSKEEYQIRRAIAKSLLNVTGSHLAFPAIEKFCVGDYLKIAIAALYSHSGRASELKALDFLRQKLVNSPVSLQKHIIRLYFTISTVEQKINAFKEIKSSNVTIRYEIFLRACRLLRLKTSEETWTILKTTIEKATEEDTAIIQYLHSSPRLDTCPMEYISEFIITSLALLRKLKVDKIQEFMNHLESFMDKIPEKTLDAIILHENVDQTSFSATFCVKYIQDSSTLPIAEHRLSNMWRLLQNVIRNSWDTKTPRPYDSNSVDYPTRILTFAFVSSLCQHQMEDAAKASLKRQVFQTLLEKFKAESVTKFFKEILYLELALLLVNVVDKTGNDRLRSFGQSLARLMDSLVSIYGGEIILILKDAVNDYVQACFMIEFAKNIGSVVELVDGILETSKTRANQIVSIFFLRSATPKSSELLATLEKINNVLKEANDVVAQMYYGSITC